MKKEEVRARLEEIGIIPALRVSSAEEAHFAVKAVSDGGIPIVEIPMTVPGAIEVPSGKECARDHRRYGKRLRYRNGTALTGGGGKIPDE